MNVLPPGLSSGKWINIYQITRRHIPWKNWAIPSALDDLSQDDQQFGSDEDTRHHNGHHYQQLPFYTAALSEDYGRIQQAYGLIPRRLKFRLLTYE